MHQMLFSKVDGGLKEEQHEPVRKSRHTSQQIMDDRHFQQLLEYLGLSWAGYRKVRKGVKKRIARHMEQLGCRSMEEYILILNEKEGLRFACEQLMTVSISRFFRHLALWHILGNDILPGIIKKNVAPLKVWSAGCACGEEVYSFKIVWERLRDQFEPLPALEMLATDMNPIYLDRARAGIYPRSSLREVPKEIRPIYFEPQKGKKHFAVRSFLKEGISWKVQHFFLDVPEKRFHFIFLRNSLLTYYESELRELAFQKVVDRLEPGGFLIIGAHEKIPSPASNLTPFRGNPWIFQS